MSNICGNLIHPSRTTTVAEDENVPFLVLKNPLKLIVKLDAAATFHNFILLKINTIFSTKALAYFNRIFNPNISTFEIKFCVQKHVNISMGVLYQSIYILTLALLIDEFIN